MSQALGPKVLEGTSTFLLSQGSILLINLAATPVLVRHLGADGYALYTLMWTISGYLHLLSFATSLGIQKYTAQLDHRGTASPLGELLRFVLSAQFAASVLGGLALYLGRRHVSSLFGIGPSMLPAAESLFAWTAAATPAYFMLQFGIAILYGAQDFRRYNLMQASQSGAASAVSCLLLLLGARIEALGATFFAVNMLLAASALWSCRRRILQDSEPLAEIRPGFLLFCSKGLINNLLWVLIFQVDRVFIGAYLPLAQLGYYVVATSTVQKLNTFCGAVQSTTFPLLADLHGRGETQRLQRFYLKVTELSLFVILPFTILAFAFIPQFLTLWLGAEFSERSTWPFRLLLGANLAYISTTTAGYLSWAKDAPEIPLWMLLLKFTLLACLWPILIPRWEITGTALAVFIADWITTPVSIYMVHRRFLELGWRSFADEALVRPCTAAMALAAAALVFHGYVHSWAGLLLSGCLGLTVYWGVAYLLLDQESKDLLRSWVDSKLLKGRDVAIP
ncbi:MAG: oligosaccharide flippase family protein [Elusimicrobiota bacterium]|jgi:O-antigen/teichoic acid export membrane protein